MEGFHATINELVKSKYTDGYTRRSGYNGSGVVVDLASPVEHVGPAGKLVSTDGAGVDLTESIAYQLRVAGMKQDDEIKPEHLSAALPHISRVITLWNLYNAATKAKIKVDLRATDVIKSYDARVYNLADVEDTKVAPAAPTAAAAKDAAGDKSDTEGEKDAAAASAKPAESKGEAVAKSAAEDRHGKAIFKAAEAIEKLVCDGDRVSEAQELLADSVFALNAVVAVAIHRASSEGHSWMSAQTRVAGSQPFKICRVAGSRVDAFRTYMSNHGHDCVHHLTNASINLIAGALCASSSADDMAAKITSDFTYMGDNVNGKYIHEVFKLSEGSTVRYPVGAIGKSGIVLGLQCMSSMVSHVLGKIKVQDGHALVAGIAKVLDAVQQPTVSREQISKLKTAMSHALVISMGYADAARITTETKKEAAKAMMARDPSSAGAGRSLADSVLSAPVHTEALESSIASSLQDMALGLNRAADILEIKDKIDVDFKTADIKVGASEGEVSHDRMMEMLSAARKA